MSVPPNLEELQEVIKQMQSQLCEEISVGRLYARNATAHKWKCTYRHLLLRELVSWRFLDLLSNALLLEANKHVIGARILVRAAIETFAILTYSIEKIEAIMANQASFHEFNETSHKLIFGSKNDTTNTTAVNILTILKQASKVYPLLQEMYDVLSETTHPNWDGMDFSYSNASNKEMSATFGFFAGERFTSSQVVMIGILLEFFEIEYNDRWNSNFEHFEQWLITHNSYLESTR